MKDGLNAVPLSAEEKKECSKVLTPQELHQVIIGEGSTHVASPHADDNTVVAKADRLDHAYCVVDKLVCVVHVHVGPPTVDFGQVCLKSLSQREIHIINNLPQHIHINVHVRLTSIASFALTSTPLLHSFLTSFMVCR